MSKDPLSAAFKLIREQAETIERERAHTARLERELQDATRIVALLTKQAGGKTFISDREVVEGYKTITTFPNPSMGGMDIEAT